MQILKYLFLLLLLSIVASSIFIATQKGEFSIEKSKIIKSPKALVFNYVNDFSNWEDFGDWAVQDPSLKMTYPENTIGKGASFQWEGKEGKGTVETVFVKENDSIAQKMNYNGTLSDVYWRFKDTKEGTKVTWSTKGKMSFVLKIYTAFCGGIESMIGKTYEKSLNNLDKKLVYETNTFKIKVNGVVKKLETFYVKQSFNSKISKIAKNSKIVFPKLINFCAENNIELNGKPFVIYHSFDIENDIAKVSFCLPIKEQISTSAGSDILTGKLISFQALKTTLTGDYSHLNKALGKTKDYFAKNNYIVEPFFSHIEVYTIGKNEIKSPSKWITTIYYPLKPKAIVIKPIVFIPKKSKTPIESEEKSEF
jgi:hypothetical protein